MKRLTLKEAIDGCFKAKQAELKKDGAAGRWMSPLSSHIIPKLGSIPVEDIDQHTLVDIGGGHVRMENGRDFSPSIMSCT